MQFKRRVAETGAGRHNTVENLTALRSIRLDANAGSYSRPVRFRALQLQVEPAVIVPGILEQSTYISVARKRAAEHFENVLITVAIKVGECDPRSEERRV